MDAHEGLSDPVLTRLAEEDKVPWHNVTKSRGGRVIANGCLRKEARREHLDYKQGAAE